MGMIGSPSIVSELGNWLQQRLSALGLGSDGSVTQGSPLGSMQSFYDQAANLPGVSSDGSVSDPTQALRDWYAMPGNVSTGGQTMGQKLGQLGSALQNWGGASAQANAPTDADNAAGVAQAQQSIQQAKAATPGVSLSSLGGGAMLPIPGAPAFRTNSQI
jgi:hypothetical protein